MCTTEQSSIEPGLRTAVKTIDAAERRRRPRKVYSILLQLAEQEEATAPDTPRGQPID